MTEGGRCSAASVHPARSSRCCTRPCLDY